MYLRSAKLGSMSESAIKTKEISPRHKFTNLSIQLFSLPESKRKSSVNAKIRSTFKTPAITILHKSLRACNYVKPNKTISQERTTLTCTPLFIHTTHVHDIRSLSRSHFVSCLIRRSYFQCVSQLRLEENGVIRCVNVSWLHMVSHIYDLLQPQHFLLTRVPPVSNI